MTIEDEVHEYATLAGGVVSGLRLALGARADDETRDAIETIASHAAALEEAARTPPCDLLELGWRIHASRQAWRSLGRPAHAVANGVPAAMLARLEALGRAER